MLTVNGEGVPGGIDGLEEYSAGEFVVTIKPNGHADAIERKTAGRERESHDL